MGKFSQYTPATVPSDYVDGTTFLIQNPDGTTKLANLEDLKKTFFCGIYCNSVTISTIDVLQLNSIPIEIVPTPGAGFAIDVISASGKIDYGGIAYATNTSLELITVGSAVGQISNTSLLPAVANGLAKFNPVVGAISMLENAALNVSVMTGDPTAGNSDIQIFVLYRLLSV